MTTGILGGTFDPPQIGHVALARAAVEQLPIARLLVLVAAAPGHRRVVAPAEERLRLAQLAFDFADEVALDEHAYTVDAVRCGRFGDAIFIVGADEGAAFPAWKEPEEVLRHVRLAVGTRSGYPPPDLERYGDRVLSFELDLAAGLLERGARADRPRQAGRRPRPTGGRGRDREARPLPRLHWRRSREDLTRP